MYVEAQSIHAQRTNFRLHCFLEKARIQMKNIWLTVFIAKKIASYDLNIN